MLRAVIQRTAESVNTWVLRAAISAEPGQTEQRGRRRRAASEGQTLRRPQHRTAAPDEGSLSVCLSVWLVLYVWWPWLTSKCVARVCQHQLSYLYWMEVVTQAIRRVKLQSNRHYQQTNTQLFTGLSPNQQFQSSEGKSQMRFLCDLCLPLYICLTKSAKSVYKNVQQLCACAYMSSTTV